MGYGIMCILMGVFVFFCAFRDFDWFMNSRSARLFMTLFGRKVSRVIYMIIGILFIAAGIYFAIFGIE
jgi:hypothetical protein